MRGIHLNETIEIARQNAILNSDNPEDTIELKLPLHYVEFLLSYLDQDADINESVSEIYEEIHLQTYE